MPGKLKQATVKRLLKKASLNNENYRHLPFISKIIEKVAVKQVENQKIAYMNPFNKPLHD